MTALTVTATDKIKSNAVRIEAATLLLDGAETGGTPFLDGLFGPAGFASAPETILNQVEAIALAVMRVAHNGTSVYPVGLPIYTIGVIDPPAATSWTGSAIYVSNGAGGSPVMAFSNGSQWLRCDTLAPIST